ncbi:MAG: patatin-like phospholipase family protein [Patescibacteria group bacterium]|nr:patatin-like phospholipase family protein [Patescibacteria group bacterium]MDE2015698.1 patatin-like phospholipase family protein [Patescibacteria group bacterium]MDE2226756.1 patatin-like phospholipase family protein [Patescibacteria group bacterium]
MIKTKKLGLALGGGGAKGLAHIGVIKELERAGVPIDFIAGTSMGAIIGGWYAATKDIEHIENIFLKLKFRDIFPFREFIRHKEGSLAGGERMKALLDGHMKDLKIENCKIPFAAVATDVKNGEAVVIKKGNLAEAARASSALPVIFRAVPLGGKLLMDGGFSDPIPVDVAREMGADFVLAVDVSSKWLKEDGNGSEDVKSVYSAISNSMALVEYQLARPIIKNADLVLRPPVLNFNLLGFGDSGQIISLGEEEARLYMEEIRKGAGIREPRKTTGEKFIDFLFNSDKN